LVRWEDRESCGVKSTGRTREEKGCRKKQRGKLGGGEQKGTRVQKTHEKKTRSEKVRQRGKPGEGEKFWKLESGNGTKRKKTGRTQIKPGGKGRKKKVSQKKKKRRRKKEDIDWVIQRKKG